MMKMSDAWIFVVIAHFTNSPRVDVLLHRDTLSRFRANQYLILLLVAVRL